MTPKLIGFVSLCLGTLSSLAQSSLYISPGTGLFIGTGTILSTDSLVIIPSANFTISGQNALTKNTSVTHSTTNPYIQRVFHLSSTLSSYSGSISIYYLDPELNGIAENSLTLNIHNGTAWNAFTTGVTRDATNNFVTTTGLNNISLNELTLASLSAPLPLTYILFNASCTGNNVTLHWKTAQEFSTKNFEIEKSADGITWQSIGSVPAAGYSVTERSYTWVDNQPANTAFYRIIEYDVDGRKNISVIIRSSCSLSDLFAVYPNPVHTISTINININKPAALSLKLYDAKAALVKQLQTSLLQGTNLLQLDMTGLASGPYSLIVRWDNTVKTIKILKE